MKRPRADRPLYFLSVRQTAYGTIFPKVAGVEARAFGPFGPSYRVDVWKIGSARPVWSGQYGALKLAPEGSPSDLAYHAGAQVIRTLEFGFKPPKRTGAARRGRTRELGLVPP